MHSYTTLGVCVDAAISWRRQLTGTTPVILRRESLWLDDFEMTGVGDTIIVTTLSYGSCGGKTGTHLQFLGLRNL